MNLTDYRDITALLQRHGFRFSKSISFCIINHLLLQFFDSIQTITNNDRKDY